MMKKIRLVILFSIFINSLLFGQTYNINDFKADSLNTWQVLISGDLNSEIYNYNSTGSNGRESSYLYFYPEISFSQERIRKNSILSTSLNSNIYYRRTNNTYDGINSNSVTTRHYLRYSLSGTASYTRYFINNFGATISGYGGLSLSKTDLGITNKYVESQKIKTNSDTKSTKLTLGINPGLVWGRTYNAQYNAKAMEIINEIKKEGYLKRDLTKEEYLELSQIILERQAMYHYDNRIKKMEALTEIISYLRDIKVIDSGEVMPSLIAEDIYSYDLTNVRVPRRMGFIFGINGILSMLDSNSDTDSKGKIYYYNESNYSLYTIEDGDEKENYDYFEKGIELKAEYNKIVNWKIYHNIGLTLSKSHQDIERFEDEKYVTTYVIPDTTSTENDEYGLDYDYDYSDIDLYYNFYYQLTSRSIFHLNMEFSYTKTDYKYSSDDSDYEEKINNEHYSLDITPEFTYYFTPKMYLSTEAEYSFNKYWEKEYESKSYLGLDKSFYNCYTLNIGVGYYF